MVATIEQEKNRQGLTGNKGHYSDVIAFCPTCKAVQSITISRGHLSQTRKFVQRGNTIFHDCGTNTPCRLYIIN